MDEHVGFRTPLAVAAVRGGILGFAQFGIFFADLPGSQAVAPRVLTAAVLGAASGFALGRLRPGDWVPLSLLATWGAVLWGATLGLMRADGWLAVLGLPTGLAVLGGCAGAAWGRRRIGERGLSRSTRPPPGAGS